MSIISASTTSTTAYKVTADTTGTLVLQTGATPTTAVTVGTDQSVTLAGTLAVQSQNISPYTGFKNRIINGAMVIDQRNAGASVTPVNQQYTLDRWLSIVGVASKFTVQQNAGSVTPPAGFINYLGATSTSAYSVAAGDVFGQETRIEGLNTADLAWGTANAKPITVSFWVYSSLTGNFGCVIRNNANTRSYPFLYSISSANTWEYKTVTIPGDTSGTWLTNNLSGVKLTVNLGCGSTYSGTAGAWASAEYYSATGATSVVGTNGATFYITGVQIEKGSTATSFDYRPYGTELQLCQRYFEKSYAIGTAPGTATSLGMKASAGMTGTTTTQYLVDGFQYRVIKRASPSVVFYDSTGASGRINSTSVGVSSATNQVALLGGESNEATITVVRDTGGTAANALVWHFTASAEL